jgi:hypothetical protein
MSPTVGNRAQEKDNNVSFQNDTILKKLGYYYIKFEHIAIEPERRIIK